MNGGGECTAHRFLVKCVVQVNCHNKSYKMNREKNLNVNFYVLFCWVLERKKLYILIKCVGWCLAVNLLHLSNHLLLVYLCPPVANVVVSSENEGEERW